MYFTDSEKTAVRKAIAALNAALLESVKEVNISTAGGRIKFVDPNGAGSPWLGHELCSSDSFVNGFSAFNTQDAFHPNAAGQKAYTELIASQLVIS